MALTTTLGVTLRSTLTSALDLSTPRDDLSLTFSDALASGTGLDAADVLWHDTRTLTTGTSDSIDLAGSLTNGLGATVWFVKIKLLYIQNKTTTAGYKIGVGGSATNQFINWVGAANDLVYVGPGGLFLLYDPSLASYAVTSSTGDLLKIDNANAASVTYDIVIVGASA